MRGGARGGTVAVKAVGVARAPPLPAITVDGGLQLPRRAQALLLTLKRVQILHVPARRHRSQALRYSLMFSIIRIGGHHDDAHALA